MNCRTPQSTHHTYHINSRLSIRACTCRLMTFLHAATSARPTGSERLYNNAFCSRTTVFCGKKNNIPPAGFQNVAIFTARCYARAAYAIMRCVCVCVSVTFVHSVKTNKDIFEIFSPSGINTILVFLYQTAWQYSEGNPSNGGVECRCGRQKSRF